MDLGCLEEIGTAPTLKEKTAWQDFYMERMQLTTLSLRVAFVEELLLLPRRGEDSVALLSVFGVDLLPSLFTNAIMMTLRDGKYCEYSRKDGV